MHETLLLNNVYNVGKISANNSYKSVGGLVGDLGGGPQQVRAAILNSYNAGEVSGSTSSKVGLLIGQMYASMVTSNKIENCYYLTQGSLPAVGYNNSQSTDKGTKKSDAELKAVGMPGLLNASQNPGPWYRDDNMNNGWPILMMVIESSQEAPEMTVSPNPLSIVYGSTGTITYTYNGDGDITAVSSAVGVCTVTVDINSKTVTVSTVAVGSSVVTISAAETDSYEAISKTVAVEVTRKPIAVPPAITGLVYNGYEQTGVNSGTGYTITGNTGTAAGNYTAVATPTSNYMWTDNTYTARNIAWSIARKGIAKPTASNRTYNRSVQTGVSTGEGYSLTGNPTATDHGTYYVTVTLDSNHQWADGSITNLSLSWTMYSKNITDSDVTKNISTTAKTYNGSQQTQSISLSHAGAVLVNPTEYTVAYTDNVNAGTATITVTGVGNYTGTETRQFTIGRLGISVPSGINYTYNGSTQTGLNAGTGYTVGGVPSAINAGNYTATATPTANYMWTDGTINTINISWSIYQKSIPVTWGSQTSWVYDGASHIPSASAASGVTNETIVLSVVTAQTNVGTYNATASISSVSGGQGLAGNYTLTNTTQQFIITRKPIAKPVATDRTYNRTEQVGVSTGEGYSLTGNSTATNQGIYTVTVTLNGNYQWSDNGSNSTSNLTLSWTMYRKDIGDNDVGKTIGTETRTYNGTAHTQTISLTHVGVTLSNQTEYTVTYTDNVNAGIVTITITGQGNYTGTVTSTFVINRTNQTITIENKTVNYNPNDVPVPIGDAVVTGVNGTVLNVGVTYTYYTNSTCTIQTTTADGATGNGQPPAYVGVYYVVVSVAQSLNYNAASITVTLTINKIDNTLVVAGVQNLRYIEAPQTLVTVSTPQGDVYFLIGSTPLNSSNYLSSGSTTLPQGTNAGTYVVQYYTPGTRNYKEKAGSVSVVIIDTYYKDNASPVNYYISLQEAFSQIETGKTLLVMKDVTDNNQATLTENKTVVLDLNGKTITTNAADSFIVNHGVFTIKDGQNAGGKIYSKSTATLRLVNIGNTFTMESGTLAMDQIDDGSQFPSTLLINAGATAYVRDGATISANRTEHLDAITLSVFVASGKLVMTGGNIVATKSVYGGTTAIINQAAYGNAEIEISGGSVTSNNGNAIDLVDHVANFGGQYNGSSIKISGNARIEGKANGIFNNKAIGGITIDGATIIGGEAGIYQTVQNTITLNGGTITGNYGAQIIDGTFDMKGGKVEASINAVETAHGKLIIRNGEVSGGPTATGLVNWGNGYIEVIGGTVSGGYAGIYSDKYSAGEVRIKGGNIIDNSYIASDPASGSGIYNNGNTNVYVEGGEITAALRGVYNMGTGTVTIGTKGGEVSITIPSIRGEIFGVESVNNFNFYDGILKGKVDAFSGNVTPETNYIIYYGKELINNVQYKTAILIKDTIEIPASGKPVITEWTVPVNLDGNGFTTTIKIPIPANAKAYKVDWGDSVVEFVDANVGFKEHLYKNTAEQTYTIKASGYIDSFGYYGEAVPTKDNVYKDYYDFTQYVTAIKDWGVIEAKRYGFSNCTKLNSTIPSLKKVSFKNITDISLLFNNCSGLDIELQKDLFSDCTHLQYFNSTFNGCSKIKGTLPRELFASNTDVRKVARIFKGCSSLVGADIEIDSNNITTMDEMFSGCTNIKTIVFEEKFKDLVGIKMFEGCNNLKSIVTLYEYSG